MLHVVKGALVLVAALIVTAFTPVDLSSPVPPMQQMFIMKEVKPDLQRLGILWNPEVNDEETLTKIRRAGTSLKVQLFLAEVSDISDIAPQFRQLTRTHKVGALWVVTNDGLIDSATGKSFLIKNAMKAGLPLFVPSRDWVDDGAFLTMEKQAEGLSLIVNKPAAEALSLSIPDKYAERTQFAAN